MNAIPCHCEISETISDQSYESEIGLTFSKIDKRIAFGGDVDKLVSCWKIVLLTATTMGKHKVDDCKLLRFIKDANDNGIDNVMDFEDLVEDDEEEEYHALQSGDTSENNDGDGDDGDESEAHNDNNSRDKEKSKTKHDDTHDDEKSEINFESVTKRK